MLSPLLSGSWEEFTGVLRLETERWIVLLDLHNISPVMQTNKVLYIICNYSTVYFIQQIPNSHLKQRRAKNSRRLQVCIQTGALCNYVSK